MKKPLNLSLLLIFLTPFAEAQDLRVKLVEMPPTANIVAFYEGMDIGTGNTSLEFDSNISIKSSKLKEGEAFGYFNQRGEEIAYIKRNRDLGQTFRIEGGRPKTLQSIIVSTNHGTNAVRNKMYGQRLSVQIFEVEGIPHLNKNTTDTTEALHGFPHDRVGKRIEPERDDFWEGEYFKTVRVATGGIFPTEKDFGIVDNEVITPNHPKLKGRLLEFSFVNSTILLQPLKKYAFMIIIDEAGPERGFALANHYYGTYPDGHGIRRDGSGKFPPVPFDIQKPLDTPENQKAVEDARFPTDFKKRIAIQPGTNGYPDVDTYRDLFFYVVAR
jgi:hypothetical protein